MSNQISDAGTPLHVNNTAVLDQHLLPVAQMPTRVLMFPTRRRPDPYFLHQPYYSYNPADFAKGIPVITLNPILGAIIVGPPQKTLTRFTVDIDSLLALPPELLEDIFFSQPPCRKIQIVFHGTTLRDLDPPQDDELVDMFIVTFKNANGVPIGPVVEWLRRNTSGVGKRTGKPWKDGTGDWYLEIDRCLEESSQWARMAQNSG